MPARFTGVTMALRMVPFSRAGNGGVSKMCSPTGAPDTLAVMSTVPLASKATRRWRSPDSSSANFDMRTRTTKCSIDAGKWGCLANLRGYLSRRATSPSDGGVSSTTKPGERTCMHVCRSVGR